MVTVKRFLGILTILALLASSAPFFNLTDTAFADDDDPENGTGDEIITTQCEFTLDSPVGNSPGIPADQPVPLQPGWHNIMTEGFEGTFPGSWVVNSFSPTDAYWGKDDYRSHTDSYSAFCAKNGSAGVNPPATYPNEMFSIMTYGPFSLADATDAELNFWLWLESEEPFDFVGCYASINGTHFYGAIWYGSMDWTYQSFDLTKLKPGTYEIAVGEATKTLTVLEIIIPPTPASFTTTSLEISPDEVDIGEEVTITVRVDNTGESEGVCQLVCKLNGIGIDEKEITLAGGSGESVVFTTSFDEAGNKIIEVNELSGRLDVREEDIIEEEPTLDPGTVAEVPTQEIPVQPEPESRWWIVALVVGVCAVLIAGIFIYNRRRNM